MHSKKGLLILVALILMAPSGWAEESGPMQTRQTAQKAYHDGNWKDAYELYRKLCLETKTEPKKVGADFTRPGSACASWGVWMNWTVCARK